MTKCYETLETVVLLGVSFAEVVRLHQDGILKNVADGGRPLCYSEESVREAMEYLAAKGSGDEDS